MVRPSAAAAKIIGAEHQRNGKPCQDEAGLIEIGDRVAIAVSDGHGSSQYADVGSRLAVTSTLYMLNLFAEAYEAEPLPVLHALARDVLRRNIQRGWVDAVRAYGSGDTSDLRAHGATLAFAISTPKALIIGDVGDCDILLVEADGTVTRPLMAKDYFGEQTSSLCLPESQTDFYTVVRSAPQAETLLMISTDGYSKSYPTDKDFESLGKFYLEWIRASGLDAVGAKLPKRLAEITKDGSGDDISLAMLYWAPREENMAKVEPADSNAGDAPPSPPAGASETPGVVEPE